MFVHCIKPRSEERPVAILRCLSGEDCGVVLDWMTIQSEAFKSSEEDVLYIEDEKGRIRIKFEDSKEGLVVDIFIAGTVIAFK